MKTTVIGMGEIGSILASQMIEHGVMAPADLFVYDRNQYKCDALKKRFFDVQIAPNLEAAVQKARYIFICVQPVSIAGVLKDIQSLLCEDANIFISSSNFMLSEATEVTGAKVSKFLPTVNSAIGRGVIYAAHNYKVTAEDAQAFEAIMRKICSQLYIVEEKEFAVLNNLAGCAPAFFAYFSQCLCQAVYERQHSFSYREVERIVAETLAATGQRMIEKDLTFEEICMGVGKPGGITYTALSALVDQLPASMSELVKCSVEKHGKIDQLISQKFQDLKG